MGDCANAGKGGVGFKLPAGHSSHAETDLQFVDAVLGNLAAASIPDHSVAAVAGSDVVTGLVAEQLGLAQVFAHDQVECFAGVVHAV